MQPIYLNIEFWKLLLAGLGAVLLWTANNWYQRRLDYYLRKQELYSELLVHVASLYGDSKNPEVKSELNALLEHYRRAWLYASDDVVSSASRLMDELRGPSASENGARESALSELVAAMRRDLMAKWLWLPGTPRTKLSASDFRHMRV